MARKKGPNKGFELKRKKEENNLQSIADFEKYKCSSRRISYFIQQWNGNLFQRDVNLKIIILEETQTAKEIQAAGSNREEYLAFNIGTGVAEL